MSRRARSPGAAAGGTSYHSHAALPRIAYGERKPPVIMRIHVNQKAGGRRGKKIEGGGGTARR